MKEKFNQKQYIRNFNKTHYKTFKVDLKLEEYEELENLLNKENMSKATFLRLAIEQLKNGQIKNNQAK